MLNVVYSLGEYKLHLLEWLKVGRLNIGVLNVEDTSCFTVFNSQDGFIGKVGDCRPDIIYDLL